MDTQSNETLKLKHVKIPTEIFSRICGYYRPIAHANIGKAEEIRQRKTYDANGRTEDYA